MGAKAAPDAIGPLVLTLCIPQRIRAVVRGAVSHPRALRPRHGRRVGSRHAARPRALAGASSRPGFRAAARRLVLGLSPVRGGVPLRLSTVQRYTRPRVAGHVLGLHHSRALHVLDSRTRSREPGVAGAAAAEEEWRRNQWAEALPGPDLSERSSRHDDSDHAGHRIVHVHLLLAEFLVSHGLARRGAYEPSAAVSVGLQRRRNSWHCELGTIVRRTTRTSRRLHSHADPRAG